MMTKLRMKTPMKKRNGPLKPRMEPSANWPVKVPKKRA
jgi:hypothetical protein